MPEIRMIYSCKFNIKLQIIQKKLLFNNTLIYYNLYIYKYLEKK